MISIETALKLRDHNFIQHQTGAQGTFTMHDGLMVYLPTLSELIEKCGVSFKYLERMRSPDEEGTFWAQSDDIGICGLSPEEAVANLFIALKDNEK